MEPRPALNLEVGTEVLTRNGSNYSTRRVEYTTGKVISIARKYATVDFGVWYLDGRYDLVTGQRSDKQRYITTQARLDWDRARESDRAALQAVGLEGGWRLSEGLRAAVAAFLKTVDRNGDPIPDQPRPDDLAGLVDQETAG